MTRCARRSGDLLRYRRRDPIEAPANGHAFNWCVI